MKKSRLGAALAALLLLMCAALVGQSSLPDYPRSFSQEKYQAAGYVPSTLTSLGTRDVAIDFLRFGNDDASLTATIRVVDGTTNCGGAPCPIIPDVTLSPKTVYLMYMNGEVVKGGLKWQATGSSKVVGYVKLKY